MGTKESFELSTPGRIPFDLYEYLQRNDKLRSYGLNAVSELYLKDKKEDVPHWVIRPFFYDGPLKRKRINEYCYKDTKLPVDIILKRQLIPANIEMSRVVGVPYRW